MYSATTTKSRNETSVSTDDRFLWQRNGQLLGDVLSERGTQSVKDYVRTSQWNLLHKNDTNITYRSEDKGTFSDLRSF